MSVRIWLGRASGLVGWARFTKRETPGSIVRADADNEFFSDGISEEIINAPGQIEGLRVAARSSSFSFKGKSIEVSDIARRLDVRHVLEGSVRRAGTRVRVTAQLVNAANGFQLWSERYDRQIADIFDVQDEIARAIVERLRVAFDADKSPRLVKVTTNNMEAYQEYLKGRAMLYRLFRLARSGARIIGAGVDATLDPARLESDLDSYPVAGILIG